jgi:prevent-host-death family protein
MEKTISSQDAPQRIGDVLHEVSDNGDRYVVEQDGVPLAAVIPFGLYAQWKQRRETFFAQMRETAERANLSEDEAIQLTDEAKQAVRARS